MTATTLEAPAAPTTEQGPIKLDIAVTGRTVYDLVEALELIAHQVQKDHTEGGNAAPGRSYRYDLTVNRSGS